MKNITLIIVMGIALAGCSGSFQRFDRTDWVLAGADTLAHLGDYYTTSQLKAHYIEETNPIIEDQDPTKTACYFASTWVLKMAVGWALPPKWRKAWFVLGAVNGAAYTINNKNLIDNSEY